jgi:hypothetical protein
MVSVPTATVRMKDEKTKIMYLPEAPLFAKQRGAGGEFMNSE